MDGTEGEPRWQSMKENQEELHGIGKPEMSIYRDRCTHTHTQELDTPVPTTGYCSYKALTPPPLGTQGNWKQDKSLHRFPSIVCLLCAMGQSPI